MEFWTFTYKDLVRACKSQGYNTWREFKDTYSLVERELSGRKRRGINSRGSDGWKELLSNAARNRKPSCKTWKVIDPAGNIEIIENLSLYCRDRNLNRSNIKGDHGSKGYRAEELRNHRIVSVEKLTDKMTVGSMSIDTEETYHSHHTYLLDAGVYTKNTMLEDYWLPRREGGRGTEVTTLPGGQTLGEMDDVLYFQKRLYQTLNVPVNRLNSDALFSIGRATEVTRDELKFYKFIVRLRGRFSSLFNQVLEKQLVLKGVMSIEEWYQIANEVKYDFARDNYFTELKDAEILQNRAQLMMTMEQGGLVGKYYSHEWARRNILRQSDDDIEEQDEQINSEQDDPRWNPPMPDMGDLGQDNPELQDDMSQSEPGPDDKTKELKQAMLVKKQMEEKGADGRSIQDESKYRSALMLLAKNKQIVDKMNI